MVALRVHLDECDNSNGPLRVIPGSHLLGKLSDDDIETTARASRSIEIAVRQGDAVIMRPLLLHASSQAHVPGHRRVLHIEFASSL